MILLTSPVTPGFSGFAVTSHRQMHKLIDSASYGSMNTVPTYMQFLKIRDAVNKLHMLSQSL